MTIILFLVDTSASMNQRAYLGGRPSLLDVAKGAVETFVKIRQRSPDSRGDRYMLLTFEEPPFNIKAAWKESLSTFMTELKNLQATGMTTLGAALKATFDLLNINRMQTGIDMYGQGRYPFYLEPAFIVAITDGGRLTHNGGMQEELHLPMNPNIPGAELTREPFRWDQRLFSLVLRLTGTPPLERDPMGLVPSDSSPIDSMCEVTGGRSYTISSHRMLMQCVESLVQKIQSGVVIQFEKIGPDPPLLAIDSKGEANNGEIVAESEESKLLNSSSGWQYCRKMIYVPRSAQKGFAVGFWPIPEAFWPDTNAPSLPPRTAHPVVKFTCTNQEPMIIENLPFDKYEVEPCPLTQFILQRKQATTCWQVFVSNSYKSNETGHAFGYLKASTNLQSVNLFVMPYNYPVLLPLLDDLFKIHRMKPSTEWRTQFSNYLRTMPPYYAAPLRRALNRMGASTLANQLVSESLDNSLSYSVVNYLKRLKNQAKMEFDRICSEVGRHRPVLADSVKVIWRTPLRKDFVSNPSLAAKFAHLRDQLNDFAGFTLALKERDVRPQSLRNPFDIPRSAVLDQLARMRANFLQPSLNHTKLHDDDHIHSMPVSQMGNYQDYLKRIPPPLREIESTPVRQHMFGNPFKIDKRMMVDEADIDLVGGSAGHGGGRSAKRAAEASNAVAQRPSKRKPGPLSRDITLRRSPSPAPRPPSPSLFPPYLPPPASPVSPVAVESSAKTESSVSVPASPLLSPTAEEPEVAVVPEEAAPAAAATPNPSLVNGKTTEPEAETKIEVAKPTTTTTTTTTVPVAEAAEPTTPLVSEAELPPRLLNGVLEPKGNFDLSSHSYSTMANGISHTTEKKTKSNGLPVLSKVELEEIRRHNNQIRGAAFKLIRRPGKNYEGLFKEMSRLQGSVDVQKPIAMDIVAECLRFKRRVLAELVTQWIRDLENVR